MVLLFKIIFAVAAVTGLITLLVSFMAQSEVRGVLRKTGIAASVLGSFLFFCSLSIQTIPSGHVGAASLFGDVQTRSYEQGLHFPVNPLYSWTIYDARNKTTKLEDATIQTSDELTSFVDISVQFRLNGAMAPTMLQETGNGEMVIETHLTPRIRSIVREQGKAVEVAQDLFDKSVQEKLQADILDAAQTTLSDYGILVEAVLIRQVDLPKFIVQAIENKKQREQEVEREQAELERVALEKQQEVKAAEAARDAAVLTAEAKRTLADATAYEIERINTAMQGNPAYLTLRSIEAMEQISTNPANQIYWMDGSAPNPLPLINLGKQGAKNAVIDGKP